MRGGLDQGQPARKIAPADSQVCMHMLHAYVQMDAFKHRWMHVGKIG